MKNILLLLFVFSSISVFIQQKYFDPDGYYFPETEFSIGGIKIDNIELRTLDYYQNGKLNYDNPKFVKPEIIISLIDSKKRIKPIDIVVNKDTLFFHIKLLENKVLEFSGNFIDKRGQFWNQNDVKPEKTIVMKGKFKLFVNGKINDKKEVKFTYWEGD